jgi:RHO1 GDP-GTP exchange protein 1/2
MARPGFRRVLPYVNPIQMATVHAHGPKTFNKFLIHHESSLLAYSLDILGRVALGQADVDVLNGSMEKIARHDVIFFRHAIIGQRALGELLIRARSTAQNKPFV